MRYLLVSVFALLLFGRPALAGDKKQLAIDKEGFLTARKAALVKTWDAAIELLNEIKVSKLEDTDVIDYVAYSKLCARTARALGVKRNANPTSPTDVISKIDWLALIAGIANNPRLLLDARAVYSGIGTYQKLDSKLVNKYGS